MERRIEALRPEAQVVCREWLRKVREELKIDARITETFRTVEDQTKDQKSGASSVKLGWHQVGLAWDFACFDISGSIIHDGSDSRYAECGRVAVELGCKWPIHLANGTTDSGHIEFHPGFTLQHYLANVTNGSVKAWTPPPQEEK